MIELFDERKVDQCHKMIILYQNYIQFVNKMLLFMRMVIN